MFVVVQELLDIIQSPTRLVGVVALVGTIVCFSLTIKVRQFSYRAAPHVPSTEF